MGGVPSGLIATRPAAARWFLERQSHVSVFHERTGLIITGGNSRGQPELATFSETIKGDTHYLPPLLEAGGTERPGGERFELGCAAGREDLDAQVLGPGGDG